MYEFVPGRDNVVADALSRPPVSATDLFDVADPHVLSELEKWLRLVAPHTTIADAITAARDSLVAGRKLCAIRCPHCAALTLDVGLRAIRKHVQQVCSVSDCGR